LSVGLAKRNPTNPDQTAVQKDIEEGARLGVTGTPAFFVNGRLLVGAQPLENLVRVIDDELARAR
jgi:protein-disulfide isomerase